MGLVQTWEKTEKKNKYKNNKGIVLVGCISLLAVLSLMGSLVVNTTNTNMKIASNFKKARQAFYVAEAGINRAMGKLNTDSNWLSSLTQPDVINVFLGDNSLGNDGIYDVKIFEDNPSPGRNKILSTGYITDSAGTSSVSVIEVIAEPVDPYLIFDYATFNCGDLKLKQQSSGYNTISGGDVYASGMIELKNGSVFKDGNIYTNGDLILKGNSYIQNGSAFSNSKIGLDSSHNPNIDGNATAPSVDGSHSLVSGSVNIASNTVADLCGGANLADITITSDKIQDFRNTHDVKKTGNYTYNPSDNLSGIVWVDGDFTLAADANFTDNMIFVVDGKVEIEGDLTSPGSATATFIVPSHDVYIQNAANVTLDGSMLVGTVDSDGSNVTGGNLHVVSGANLTINGSGIVVSGDTEATASGDFTVNYTAPSDSNLFSDGYRVSSWREVTE